MKSSAVFGLVLLAGACSENKVEVPGGSCGGEPLACELVAQPTTCASLRGCTFGPRCGGARPPCEEHRSSSSCPSDQDCHWEEGRCSVTSCSSFEDRATCDVEAGCQWIVSSIRCMDSDDECETLDEAACRQLPPYRNCEWNDSCVSRSYGACAVTDSAACNTMIGCAWRPGCEGNGSACNDLGQTDCAASVGCYWSDGNCYPNQYDCAKISTRGDCHATGTCIWNTIPACRTEDSECATFTEQEECRALPEHLCVWTGSSCARHLWSCSYLGGGAQCEEIVGCASEPGECAPDAAGCEVLGHAECEASESCGWYTGLPGGSCTADADRAACPALSDAECATYEGCEMITACHGTPIRCTNINSEQSCIAQAGCFWTP